MLPTWWFSFPVGSLRQYWTKGTPDVSWPWLMTLFEEFITPTISLNEKMLRHMPSLTRHWQHCVGQRKSLQWDLNGKQERWKCNLVGIGMREMGLLWVGFSGIGSFCGNLVVDSASSPQKLFCSWWYRDGIYYTQNMVFFWYRRFLQNFYPPEV